MKVMIIAPYIYDDNIIEFTKNKTGFGIMVQNIVSSVAELENVVLLTRVITKGKKKRKSLSAYRGVCGFISGTGDSV